MPEQEHDPAASESYLLALLTGLRFIRQDRLVRGILLMVFVTNLADAAYGTVLAPVWASEVIGSPIALGFLSGAFAIGAVLGNVAFTAVAPRMPRYWVFTIGFLIAGAPRFVVLAITDRLWAVYVVSFVAGVSIAAVNPIFGALSYERIPERLRARVLGLMRAVSYAGIPLGGLLGGAAVGGLALPAACLLFGLAYLAVTLWPFLDRAWRTMDERPTPARQPMPA